MNAKTIAAIIAFAFAANASAAGNQDEAALSAVAVNAKASLVVDCHNEKLPSHRAIAEVLETNNASAINAGREVVIHYAHRECMRGAGYVAFVRDENTLPATLALTAR